MRHDKKLSVLLLFVLGFAHCAVFAAKDIRLATTTSTENSGLLKAILPVFEAKYGAKVRVIAVGTGKALKLGENGDVDVVLVHSRPDEDRFIQAGFGVNRRDVMHNDFVIVGPKNDPARIRGMSDAAGAFRKILTAGSAFISRGDDSGTHKMELRIWNTAGLKPSGAWYISAGQGMGEVLMMAGSRQAYTLTDRGTYASYRGRVDLEILVSGDPRLYNPYGIIAVNPKRYADINFEGANALIDWVTSAAGQKLIADFKVGGEQLFFPDAALR